MERLTPREQQIYELVAEGASNPEIAACLHIRTNTVTFHRQRIRGKGYACGPVHALEKSVGWYIDEPGLAVPVAAYWPLACPRCELPGEIVMDHPHRQWLYHHRGGQIVIDRSGSDAQHGSWDSIFAQMAIGCAAAQAVRRTHIGELAKAVG